LDGEFFVGAAMAGTLTKVALRYIGIVADHKKQNVRSLHTESLPAMRSARFSGVRDKFLGFCKRLLLECFH
jgi:hypothetical protein